MFMSFLAGDLRVKKRYHYSDVDFEGLRERYGNELIERLCFHVMALEAIPVADFRPSELDPGPFARFHTPRFERLWRTVFTKAGAQWRYENNLANYVGPNFLSDTPGRRCSPIAIETGAVDTLCFCGGGKDSLAAMKLFESAGLGFSSYSYSHPAYGAPATQLALIESLLDSNRPERRHWVEIETDRISDGGLCAETPISIFGALPIALQHGYRWLVLGNERSAEEPNLRWPETGEFVNHQWGKSVEAELLVGDYIRDELISNLQCFSVLRPMHDMVIFNFLRRFPEALKRAHSCNYNKPWCYRCGKCAYVGLSFTAYLPYDLASEIVAPDLFDNEANERLFGELLGLTGHKPFECIGETGETRLAFEICRLKGIRGRAVDLYSSRLPPLDAVERASVYSEISPPAASFPAELWRCLSPLMLTASRDSFRYVSSVCGFRQALAGAGLASSNV